MNAQHAGLQRQLSMGSQQIQQQPQPQQENTGNMFQRQLSNTDPQMMMQSQQMILQQQQQQQQFQQGQMQQNPQQFSGQAPF